MDLPIEIDRERITAFCRKYHLTKLALFGSVLTDPSVRTATWTSWSSSIRNIFRA